MKKTVNNKICINAKYCKQLCNLTQGGCRENNFRPVPIVNFLEMHLAERAAALPGRGRRSRQRVTG